MGGAHFLFYVNVSVESLKEDWGEDSKCWTHVVSYRSRLEDWELAHGTCFQADFPPAIIELLSVASDLYV